MNDNKGQTIFLSVIGIATLLVAIIGATFAYFTTQMSNGGDEANANLTTAKVGTVEYVATGIGEQTNLLPGWSSGAKDVSVTLTGSDVSYDYSCYLQVTKNEKGTGTDAAQISDMYLTAAKKDASATNVTIADGLATVEGYQIKVDDVNKKIKIASGTLAANTGGAESKAEFTYTLTFKNAGNQNAQQGAKFEATVACESSTENSATLYYDTNSPSGRPTENYTPAGE